MEKIVYILLSAVIFQTVVAFNAYSQEAISEEAYKQKMVEVAKATEVNMFFWGKAVDQYALPVVDANVDVSIDQFDYNKLEPAELSKTYKTDQNGEFKISAKGSSIGITKINKYLYEYAYEQNPRMVFGYSSECIPAHRYTPSPDKPFMFYLRKKGEPAYLIGDWGKDQRFNRGVLNNFKLRLFTDWLDPNGKQHDLSSASPSIFVKGCPIADTNDGYAVTFIAPDANSGVLLSDTLLYEAPENGYKSLAEQAIQFSKTDHILKRYLYVKGRGNVYYSRVNIKIPIFEDRFYVGYDVFTNPAGSRHLEYDSDFQNTEWKKRDQKREQLIQERMRKAKSAQTHDANN